MYSISMLIMVMIYWKSGKNETNMVLLLSKNFIHAMEQITDYYKDDLMGVDIQYAGDTGMITTGNKEIAEAFKKSYIKTHYGEDEE